MNDDEVRPIMMALAERGSRRPPDEVIDAAFANEVALRDDAPSRRPALVAASILLLVLGLGATALLSSGDERSSDPATPSLITDESVLTDPTALDVATTVPTTVVAATTGTTAYAPADDPFWQTEGGRNFAEAYRAGFLLVEVPGHPEGGLVSEEFSLWGEPGEIMEVRNWSRELVGYYLADAGVVSVQDVDLADPQWERLAAEIVSEGPGASFCSGGEDGGAPVCVDEPPFFEQLEKNGGFGPVQPSPPIPDRDASD
jgi:hypothetical protein